jgi:hypothetical protein
VHFFQGWEFLKKTGWGAAVMDEIVNFLSQLKQRGMNGSVTGIEKPDPLGNKIKEKGQR